SLRRSAVRHIELVAVAEQRILVVVITDTGRVQQKTIEIDANLDESALGELRVRLNAATIGARISQVPEEIRAGKVFFNDSLHATIDIIADVLKDSQSDEVEDRVFWREQRILLDPILISRVPLAQFWTPSKNTLFYCVSCVKWRMMKWTWLYASVQKTFTMALWKRRWSQRVTV